MFPLGLRRFLFSTVFFVPVFLAFSLLTLTASPEVSPSGAAVRKQAASGIDPVSLINKKMAMQHFLRGKDLHTRQMYKGAIQEYRKALTLYPEWKKVQRTMAWAKNDLRRLQLKKATNIPTLHALVTKAETLYNRGKRLEMENNFIDSAQAYKAALLVISEYPEAQQALTRLQNKARTVLSSTLENPPSVPSVSQIPISAKAPSSRPSRPLPENVISQIKSSRSPLPQSHARPANSVPQAIQTHFLIGSQALNNRDYALAIQQFELILEFVPHHKKSIYKLNLAKKRLAHEIKIARRKIKPAQSAQDPMKEIKAIRDLLKLAPHNKNAQALWEKAKKRNQTMVDDLFRKSVNLYVDRQYLKALDMLDLILDINPEHKKALDSISKVREKMLLMSSQDENSPNASAQQ